jgi:hypothetical protein
MESVLRELAVCCAAPRHANLLRVEALVRPGRGPQRDIPPAWPIPCLSARPAADSGSAASLSEARSACGEQPRRAARICSPVGQYASALAPPA